MKFSNSYGQSDFRPYASNHNSNMRFKSRSNKYGRAPKKRSGATYGQTEKGKPYIRAWRATKQTGLQTLIAVPSKKHTKTVKTKTGKQYTIWVATITSNGGMNERTLNCLYSQTEKKLRIPDMNLVVSINKNYFGTSIKKQYN